MTDRVSKALRTIVDDIGPRLRVVDESVAATKSRPDVWSAKEVLGHLIDSAANNHHRFVRAQQAAPYEGPGYDQDVWVRAQDYQSRPWLELVDLWVAYNRHLAHVIAGIPDTALSGQCRVGSYPPCTLAYLVDDYVVHLQNHLTQIEGRVG